MNGASEEAGQAAEIPHCAPFGGEFAEKTVALRVSSAMVVVAAMEAGVELHWYALIGPTA